MKFTTEEFFTLSRNIRNKILKKLISSRPDFFGKETSTIVNYFTNNIDFTKKTLQKDLAALLKEYDRFDIDIDAIILKETADNGLDEIVRSYTIQATNIINRQINRLESYKAPDIQPEQMGFGVRTDLLGSLIYLKQADSLQKSEEQRINKELIAHSYAYREKCQKEYDEETKSFLYINSGVYDNFEYLLLATAYIVSIKVYADCNKQLYDSFFVTNEEEKILKNLMNCSDNDFYDTKSMEIINKHPYSIELIDNGRLSLTDERLKFILETHTEDLLVKHQLISDDALQFIKKTYKIDLDYIAKECMGKSILDSVNVEKLRCVKLKIDGKATAIFNFAKEQGLISQEDKLTYISSQNATLIDYLYHETFEKIAVEPIIKDDCWICTCGMFNKSDKCLCCDASKMSVEVLLRREQKFKQYIDEQYEYYQSIHRTAAEDYAEFTKIFKNYGIQDLTTKYSVESFQKRFAQKYNSKSNQFMIKHGFLVQTLGIAAAIPLGFAFIGLIVALLGFVISTYWINGIILGLTFIIYMRVMLEVKLKAPFVIVALIGGALLSLLFTNFPYMIMSFISYSEAVYYVSYIITYAVIGLIISLITAIIKLRKKNSK